MRIRVLILFVAAQFASFLIWQHVSAVQIVPESIQSATIHAAANALFPNIHFSARNAGANRNLSANRRQLEQTITTVLERLPKAHADSIKNIILDYNSAAQRGLGGKQMVILRASMPTDEFVGVLTHEIGHNVDLIGMAPARQVTASVFKDGSTPIYISDPSLDFYRISWKNELELKRAANNLDFVSGYAMTDPFEDFAETYTYYVLHNKEFRAKVATNASLYAKYRFMKDKVFKGGEFDTGDAQAEILARPWDVTVLPYKLENFLN